MPVAEIARRAGVGTGTVSRHFPTKEALYEAIVLEQVEALLAEAGRRDFLATSNTSSPSPPSTAGSPRP